MKLLLLFLTGFLHSTPDPIAAGDTYFVQINYAQALAHYQLAPNSAEAQWKMARTYICQADISPLDKQKALYYKAVDAAHQCIQLNKQDSNGHTWLGAAPGNIANYEGSKSKVRLCNTIKHELERALALNPQDDIALSILGSFYRALANITWVERTLANMFLGVTAQGRIQRRGSRFS